MDVEKDGGAESAVLILKSKFTSDDYEIEKVIDSKLDEVSTFCTNLF